MTQVIAPVLNEVNPVDARVYTHAEQTDNLAVISLSMALIGERPLARLVWQYANIDTPNMGALSVPDYVMNESFQRQAASLRGVSLPGIYNRLRRLRGKIK